WRLPSGPSASRSWGRASPSEHRPGHTSATIRDIALFYRPPNRRPSEGRSPRWPLPSVAAPLGGRSPRWARPLAFGARWRFPLVMRRVNPKQTARGRTRWITIGTVAVLVLAGLVGWGIHQARKPDAFATPAGVTDGGGVSAGEGPVTVDVYLDFL